MLLRRIFLRQRSVMNTTWMRVVIAVDEIVAKKATHLQDKFETEFTDLASGNV